MKSKCYFRAGLIAPLFFLVLSSCRLTYEDAEYSKGAKASQDGKPAEALQHYKALVDKSVNTPLAIKAAKEAARISHYELKNFKDALGFYKHVILYSTVVSERIDAEKEIADIYFNQTLDYTQAVTEYSRLLELQHTPKENVAYRMAIARSYFYLNNFYQAQIEIDRLLNDKATLETATGAGEEALFEPMLLKANIFLTMKKIDDAIGVLKEIIAKYPQRAQTESVGLVLAVCYEEQKNFAKAIETLQALKEHDSRKGFIENKIKTLKERQSYLPGIKGFRK